MNKEYNLLMYKFYYLVRYNIKMYAKTNDIKYVDFINDLLVDIYKIGNDVNDFENTYDDNNIPIN